MVVSSNRLRVLRAERRIAQEVLAYQCQIKPSRYWRIENGLKAPTRDELRALAGALKVKQADLGFTVAGQSAVSA